MPTPLPVRHFKFKSLMGNAQIVTPWSVRLRSALSSTTAVVALGLFCYHPPAIASTVNSPEATPAVIYSQSISSQDTSLESVIAAPSLSSPLPAVDAQLNIDPIGSPHPLPWSWVLEVQSRTLPTPLPQLFYYRTPALVSPDGTHSTYSRMQIRRVEDPTQSQISSILFLENMETGELEFLAASSPVMQHILLQGNSSQQPGMLSVLMPVSWSEDGDRVLVRAFESIFSTDIAADYAIVWDQSVNQVEQVIPTNVEYSNAILLGWSQTHPDHVLFRVGNLGDEAWPLMAIEETNHGNIMVTDEPIIYGETITAVWNGPQFSSIDAVAID